MEKTMPKWIKTIGKIEVVFGMILIIIGLLMSLIDIIPLIKYGGFSGFGIIPAIGYISTGVFLYFAGSLLLKSKIAGKVMTVIVGLWVAFSFIIQPLIINPLKKVKKKTTHASLKEDVADFPFVNSVEIGLPPHEDHWMVNMVLAKHPGNMYIECDLDVVHDDIRSNQIFDKVFELVKDTKPCAVYDVIIRAKTDEKCWDERIMNLNYSDKTRLCTMGDRTKKPYNTCTRKYYE